MIMKNPKSKMSMMTLLRVNSGMTMSLYSMRMMMKGKMRKMSKEKILKRKI